MGVSVEGLQRRVGRGFTLDVPALRIGSGCAGLILGPSGSGKSSFLRLLAGLEKPDVGTIRIGADAVAGPDRWIPPHRRGVALLAQDFGLWPHLSAVRHLAFVRSGGRSLKAGREERELLAQVGLADKVDARPGRLSGGEQQRLALARALAARPRLLLLDEPFANVDVVLASQLHDLIDRLRRERGFTLIQVAHYARKAVGSADTVAIFRGGRLVQSGPWRDIAVSPADDWTRQVVEVFA